MQLTLYDFNDITDEDFSPEMRPWPKRLKIFGNMLKIMLSSRSD